jgi:TP901 family phage tail tape measure protein
VSIARTGTLVVRMVGDTSGLTSMGSKLTSTGMKLTRGLTLPLAVVGTVAASVEAKYSASMKTLQVASGASAKSMQQLDKLALKMGASTVFGAGDAADAMVELAKAGLKPAQIEAGALQGSMNLAATEGMNLADAATVVANSMAQFNLKASEASRVADVLAAGSKASTASVESLSFGLRQVGPAAQVAGLSLNDTVGTLALFDANALKGQDAGTSLKTMLARLVPTTDAAKSAMADLGLKLVDQHGNFKSIVAIAGQLHGAFKGMSESQRAAAVNTIFGSDAQRAANILIDEGAGGLAKYIKATREKGVAEKMAQARMSGVAGAVEQMKGSLETAAILFMRTVAPAIATVANKLSDFFFMLSSLPASVRTVIVVIALLAAVMGPLLSILGALIAPITGIIGLFEAYAVASTLAAEGTTTLGGSLLLVLGPIALVVAALAVLGLAFFIAYKKSETFRAIVDASLSAVLTAAQAVWTWLKANWPALLVILTGPFGVALLLIIHFWKQISDAFKTGVAVLKAIWSKFGDDFINIAKIYLDMVAKIVMGGLKIVDGIFKTIGALLRGDWSGAWDGIKQIASGALDVIKAIVTGGLKLIWAAIKLYGKLWGTAIGTAWNAIQNVFTDKIGALVSKMTSAGRSLIGGLKDGITGALSDIGSWVKGNVVDPIVNAVKGFFGISSPSKVFEWIGGHLMSGLFKGLSNSNWLDVARNIFGGLPEALGAMVKKGLVSIGELPKKALNALMSLGGMFGSFFGGIGGGFTVAPGTAAADVVRRVVQSMQPSWGIDPEWSALVALINSESGFNPTAQNPTSSAYGMFQFLDSTWASVGGHKTSDPALQTIYGLRYIASRYGDPLSAWAFHQAHNWYGSGLSGGLFTQPTLIGVGERGPERVDVTPVGRGGRGRRGGGPIYLTLDVGGQSVTGILRGIVREELEDEFAYQAGGV